MSLRSLNIPVIDFVGKRKFALDFLCNFIDSFYSLFRFARLKIWYRLYGWYIN